MTNNRLLNHFTDLCRISSPSLQEDAVFDWYRERLEKKGFQTEFIPFENGKNLYAILPAAAENFLPVLLCAHADTVVPCDRVIPVVRDGIVRSSGDTILGADNKAALAVFLESLQQIREERLPHGQIEILITAAEEVGLIGAQQFDYSKIKAGHCIVMDASGDPGLVVNEAPGHSSFRVIVHGKKAHAGIEPEKGINAIRAAAWLTGKVRTGILDRDSVANWGSIHGGEAGNIVPDLVELGGEVRSHTSGRRDIFFKNVRNKMKKMDRKFGTTSKLDVHNEYGPYCVPENHTFLQMIRESCKKTELPFVIRRAGGCSDANIIHNNGIECLNLGCGMRQVHTVEEHIHVADLEKAAVLLRKILTDGLQRDCS